MEFLQGFCKGVFEGSTGDIGLNEHIRILLQSKEALCQLGIPSGCLAKLTSSECCSHTLNPKP